jgi:hypothetical protein
MKKTVRKKSVALLLSLALLLTTMPCVSTAAAEEIAVTPTSQTLTETTEAHTLSTEQEEISVSALTADCGILSYVDEEVFESGNHVLRLPEEETLSTYVFLNSDGTKTVYYMDENVKFVDSDGNIHEKNLTLTLRLDIMENLRMLTTTIFRRYFIFLRLNLKLSIAPVSTTNTPPPMCLL